MSKEEREKQLNVELNPSMNFAKTEPLDVHSDSSTDEAETPDRHVRFTRRRAPTREESRHPTDPKKVQTLDVNSNSSKPLEASLDESCTARYRCRLINLETLEERRQIANILFMYDLLTGKVDCPELLELIAINVPPRPSRSNIMFRPALHRTQCGNQ